MIAEVIGVLAFTLMFCGLMHNESKRRVTEAEKYGIEGWGR